MLSEKWWQFCFSLNMSNSLWLSDTIWRHRWHQAFTRSNQCWLVIVEVQWPLPDSNFARDTSVSIHSIHMNITLKKNNKNINWNSISRSFFLTCFTQRQHFQGYFFTIQFQSVGQAATCKMCWHRFAVNCRWGQCRANKNFQKYFNFCWCMI